MAKKKSLDRLGKKLTDLLGKQFKIKQKEVIYTPKPQSDKKIGKVVVVVNQKGGVGKTTTVVNLSSALAKLDMKILVIDNDPQGNTTSGLGLSKDDSLIGIYDILTSSVEIKNVIRKTLYNLEIIPSNEKLDKLRFKPSNDNQRFFKLKKHIDTIRYNYDFIFIDCPPSLDIITINAIVAADSILIPLQAEYYALEGMTKLLKIIHDIQHKVNPKLSIEGVLITMFDGRTKLSHQVLKEVRTFFGDLVYETYIPRNIKIAEAPSFGKPVIYYDPTSVGAKSYQSLAIEFLQKNNVHLGVTNG